MNINIGGVTETDKQVLKAVGPLLAVVLLFIFAGKFAASQVTKMTKKISEEEKVKQVLTEKLKVLSSVSATVGSSANTVLAAMPSTNPSLSLMYQLKILSSNYQLVLSNVKSSVDENMTSMMALNSSFDISGSKDQIFSFIKAIGGIAPITFVQKVDLSESVGAYTATVTTKTYFAPLPTKMPAVTQAITDLSSTEKALLSQMNGLSRPVVLEINVSTPSAINTNPFGQ